MAWVAVRGRLTALLGAAPVLVPVRPAPAAAGTTVRQVVRPGDTMASIARRHGLRVADVGRWNQIVAPYPVHVDEVLRLNRPPAPLPVWRTRVEPVTPASVNWAPARRCPVPPADLRRIRVSYIDLQGRHHDGG